LLLRKFTQRPWVVVGGVADTQNRLRVVEHGVAAP
jgi:hypothetical protein